MNALYSLLSFRSDQSKNLDVFNPPNVTFDQPLYVKAVETALSMNMDIIVCLGGLIDEFPRFHWMCNRR